VSNFSLQAVETLDYDFTGFPSNTSKDKCKGKGSIPEPTEDMLTAYAEAVAKLFEIKKGDDIEAALDGGDPTATSANAEPGSPEKKAKKKEEEAKAAALLGFTADLCQNSPSTEELTELPPRIRNAFMKWVYKELSDPEVSSGATPL